MLYLDETHKPIFCNRKDRKRIKRSSQLVCQDATGVIITCLCGLLAVAALMLLASPYALEAVGWVMDRLPGADAQGMDTRIVCVNSVLNAREAPSTDAETWYTLWDGCCVTVLEVRDGWALIEWWQIPGEPAWVCAEYLCTVEEFEK